jgi:hypothetical protein
LRSGGGVGPGGAVALAVELEAESNGRAGERERPGSVSLTLRFPIRTVRPLAAGSQTAPTGCRLVVEVRQAAVVVDQPLDRPGSDRPRARTSAPWVLDMLVSL